MFSKQSSNSKYVLFLPKWYPSRLDPQLGVFIQKHAAAVATFKNVVVLYVTGDPGLKINNEVTVTINEGLIEYQAFYRKSTGSFSRFLNFCRYLTLMRKLTGEIYNTLGTPEIIHSHVLLRPALMARHFARKFNIPFVHTEHWTGFIHDAYKRKSSFYRYLCRSVIASSRALTVVSDKLLEAMKSSNVICRNTVVLPNVIEVITSANVEIRPNDNIRILTVADLVEKNKNITAAMQEIARVRENYPGIEYHIIGGGEDENKLKTLARELDPQSAWIFFYGRQDNEFVLNFLQNIDFLVTNSNIETFSVITAEAIASGRPVIATRSGGPEYFVNESNGLLIQPGDGKGLEQALVTMIHSYKDYDPEKISSDILKKFGREAVGRQIIGIYESVLTQ